jgi:hypothetical protein
VPNVIPPTVEAEAYRGQKNTNLDDVEKKREKKEKDVWEGVQMGIYTNGLVKLCNEGG